MNEDNKTVTMPLSEYRRMEEKANGKFFEIHGISKERVKELEQIESKFQILEHDYESIHRKYEIEMILNVKLEAELAKYKQKKWWQFWK